MYATIINGTVAERHPVAPTLAPGESAIIMPCGPEVQPGWRLEAGALAPPLPAPAPDPVTVAHSYLLADAQSVDELRDALAVILGL